MKITKITIGRLHNLGNYEHVRYELTCDVADGESPATALVGMERILNALNPRCPHATLGDLDRKQAQLDQHRTLDDEKFHNYHGQEYVGTREEFTARIQGGIDEERAKRKAWDERHAKARKLLEDLGGAANWKDHKLDWEEGDFSDL